MNFAFLTDPLPALKPAKDSSIAMMREAARRGHEVWALARPTLAWRDGVVSAQAQRIDPAAQPATGAARWFCVLDKEMRPLTTFDAVLMRQDPPFDSEYLVATWLLERAQAAGARVYNDPRAIRDHSEKVALAEFAEFAPPTLIARDAAQLAGFIDELGEVILKPLDGMGGRGVFHVRHDDPNRNAIIETLTDYGRRSIMAQSYLPAIREGDKRILLIAGEPVPFALARVPQAGEARGNLAAGGTGIARPLTARDREIAVALGPTLWARGLFIVGLDVIGDYLTEINVTSPTCFVEIMEQTGFDVAARVIDTLERQCA